MARTATKALRALPAQRVRKVFLGIPARKAQSALDFSCLPMMVTMALTEGQEHPALLVRKA
jgi:hypothetical protein